MIIPALSRLCDVQRNGDIEAQLHQLLSENRYTCGTMGGARRTAIYVIARVSPAYQSGALTDNPAMLISGLVGVALIIVTGYLIIYNIFQISVIQDIQSYGQLKTLGTTKRQIKRLNQRGRHSACPLLVFPSALVGFLLAGLGAFPGEVNEFLYCGRPVLRKS